MLLIFSMGAHECAHAWVADLCGDDTGRALGRVTLNPLPHIELFGTIILPALCLTLSGGSFVLAQAKPVPVNFVRLRHRWRSMALVAAAGPGANLVVALCSMLLLKVLFASGLYTHEQRVDELLVACMFANVFLAVFNLLPVPPLDGSRIMTWLLPRSVRETYNSISAFGFLIVVLLVQLVPAVQIAIGWTALHVAEGISWAAGFGGRW